MLEHLENLYFQREKKCCPDMCVKIISCSYFCEKNGFNGFYTQFWKYGDEAYSCLYKDMVL